ncbi:GNAT family protein [Robertmurraya sp. DFI.2.37]|uniref:GNAT family N-acetyltransferase n=1 Tax=Robertmurraya sp. DFI.2.37 TaxID=3031819 RepID=UPI001CDA2F2E|nr:GNAT family protein [Robertmurraya sp. DFI.2.37]MDF1511347.1 GNAT family protein [Robertmurraya sp. DFI.2.37]
MTKNHWTFHPTPRPSIQDIHTRYLEGWYSAGRETFWIEKNRRIAGLIIIHDIHDTILSFDIRIGQKDRCKGYATKAIHWMMNYIFHLQHRKIRIEAYTRSDNLAMRKTLYKCGFVKEGYLRDAWENSDGSVSDSLCYAIIRKDWENKTVTPIKLEELPY